MKTTILLYCEKAECIASVYTVYTYFFLYHLHTAWENAFPIERSKLWMEN